MASNCQYNWNLSENEMLNSIVKIIDKNEIIFLYFINSFMEICALIYNKLTINYSNGLLYLKCC